jgi:PKD domain/Metallo-peptidase family M12
MPHSPPSHRGLRQWCHALAAAGLLAGLASPAAAAGPAKPNVPHAAKPAFPSITLPERGARGQRAIDLLGDRLPEVAAFYGKSPDEFKAHLLNDRSWRLDQRGRVFIVEELDQPLPATPASAAPTSLLNGSLQPLDQTFLLHSKPGAPRTIYLNFKGATLTGTAWNSNGNSLIALPFDTDGLPYSFSTAELERIQTIWQRVAEDYAPFDVNVTTEAVPLDQIARSSSTDAVFGTTVLITNSNGVYSCSCGGVAYLGVFDDTSEVYKPALVFYNQLGAGNEKYVAEAISHEAGHNMGLAHDGTATTGYYQGQGSGATGWAPIMGVGYYQALVQWSKGEYSGANNTQDDYAVMQSNGLPLRADDHGDTPATATVLGGAASGGITTVSAQGVIERPTDIDQFVFSAAAGTASFTVSPAARSANLDAWVGLRDANGNLLANINPTDALNATFSVVLPAAGTYTLSVQGTGKGDPLATGYSHYGSLGQYAISGSYVAPGNQAPKSVIVASTLRGTAPLSVSFSGIGSSDVDGSLVAYDWSFSDAAASSGTTAARAYSTPGSYTAQLRVTDNGGLSATSSVTVTVDAPVVIVPMRVADIAMSRKIAKNGTAGASAVVKLLDANGLPVSGATVAGSWSGLVSRSSTATTGSTGLASFSSPNTRATSGTFTFTVTGVSKAGFSYAPAANTETSDSIAR